MDWLLNYAGVFCPALTSLALIPIMLHGLGEQAYGLWITAATIAPLFGSLDLGIGSAVAREVGVARSAGITADTQGFIRSSANLAILLAVASTVILTVAAVPLSVSLLLTPELRAIAPAVFFLAGVTFAGNWLFDFARGVLVGMARFEVVGSLKLCGALLRLVSVIFVLHFSTSLILLAACWAICQLLLAVLSLCIVGIIEPLYSFRLRLPRWHSLAPHMSFSLASLLCNSFYNLLSQIPVLAVPFLRGSAALIPYYVGQKFPIAALAFTHCGGDVLYAVSSASSTSKDCERDTRILRSAMRWNCLVMLPVLIGFAVFAPVLFRIWMGHVPESAVGVARLVTFAVFLESLCVPVIYYLWGSGLVRQMLPAFVMGVTAGTLASLLLVRSYGVIGAAAGLLFGIATMAMVLVRVISRFSDLPLFSFAVDLRGFIAPGILCGATSFISLQCATPSGWISLLALAFPSALVFLVAFFIMGATEVERKKVSSVLPSFFKQTEALVLEAHEHAD
ncbi:MAG TPA: lipopolysaccharide biosynthesis protein [Terracidiphilus sp.]|nr:lipopolysaccharide biosynthesis protein [Terracidiphilus sp.]